MNPVENNQINTQNTFSQTEAKIQANSTLDFSAFTQIPQTTNLKKIEVTPLSLPNLQSQEAQIKNSIEYALSLNPNEIETQEVIDQIINNIIEEGKAHFNEPIKNQETLYFTPKPVSPFVIPESFIKEAPELEIGVLGLNIFSRASSAVVIKIIIDKIHEAVSAKKVMLQYEKDEDEKATLEKEIKILTGWADVHASLLKETLKESVIDTTFSLPKAASAIAVIAETAHTVAGTVIDWIGVGIGLIGNAFNFYLKNKDYHDHQKWAEVIGNKPKNIDIKDVSDKDAKPISTEVHDKIYLRQKKIFDERCKSNLPQLNKLLGSMDQDLQEAKDTSFEKKEKALSKALERLKEAGITFPEPILTIEDLQAAIKNPDLRKNMNVMMVKKKEMLSVSLRNGLRTMCQKKYSLDRGFLELAESKAMVFLGYSSVMTAATLIFKLVIAGAFALLALKTLGFGFLALLGGALGIGACYLYVKKPNVFKSYFQGLQLRLAFWKIPLAIQQFRKNYNLLESMKTSEEIRAIWQKVHLVDRLLPNSDVKDLPAYREELMKAVKKKEEEVGLLNGKIKELNESILHLDERVKPLQEQVYEAGANDFLIHLHEGKGAELGLADDFNVLAEYLLQDATILEDKRTKKILLHMGIDLGQLSDENKDSMIETLAKQIRQFFALDIKETMEFIEGQKLLEKHGLQDNTASD